MRRFKKIIAMITSLTLIAGMLPIVPTKTVEAATTRYEAEDADYGTNTLQDSDWYSSTSGGAVVGLDGVWEGEEYKAVNWTVYVAKAGKYTLTVGYCTDKQVELKAKVNDGEWKLFNEADSTTLVLPASAGWNVASRATLEVDLEEGNNTIAVSGPIVDWNANWDNVYGQKWGPSCNLDYIEISECTSITKTGAELVADGSIKMVGRSMTNGTAATFDWTASGFEFEYTGSGDIKATITSSWGASNNYAELEINVDGVKTRSTVTGTQTITLARGLTNGKHTIKVNKVNEAGFGLAHLDRIQYPVDGQLKATATKKLKFEVIGDSITCGNQIDASNSNKEDGMGSYAYLLAQKFNAELNIESVSGRGLIAGWAQENPNWGLDISAEMNTIYDYTSYFRNNQTKWDTSSYNPDLVIVNLGNNDLGPATGVTAEQYCNAVVSFSKKLRTAYPDAYILWVYGIFVNRDHSDNIATAISGLNDSKIMYKYMNQYNGGAGDHPNYEQHRTIANVLESYINENTDLVSDNKGDNDTGTDVDTVVRYEAENATYNGTVASGDWYADCSNKGIVGLDWVWIDNVSDYKFISQNFNVSKAGKYKITLHYCAPVASEFMINVNDSNWNYFDDEAGTVGHVAPATGGWNIVGTISTVVELNEGNNNIKISGPILDNHADGNFFNVYESNQDKCSSANLDCFDVSRYIEKCDISIDGTNVAQIEKGEEYTLPSDSSLGYLCGDTAYKAGTKITVNGDMAFTAIGNVSFTITRGAGIRYSGRSGLRFQVKANAEATVLQSEAVSVGMLITAYDLFTELGDNELTKDSAYNFIDVKNDGTWYQDTTGLYCSSIVNITEANYKRSFIGRAYLTITYSDETTKTVYSDMTDSRNINQVAKAVRDANYKNVPEEYRTVIDNYANAN